MEPDLLAIDKWQKVMLILPGGLYLHTQALEHSCRVELTVKNNRIYTKKQAIINDSQKKQKKRTEVDLKGLQILETWNIEY